MDNPAPLSTDDILKLTLINKLDDSAKTTPAPAQAMPPASKPPYLMIAVVLVIGVLYLKGKIKI